jgi:hypothetical protein
MAPAGWSRSVSELDLGGGAAVAELGSILWNRFGRNLRTKPYFNKFKFVIMTLN